MTAHKVEVVTYRADGNAVRRCTYQLTPQQLDTTFGPDFLEPDVPHTWKRVGREDGDEVWCDVYVDGSIRTQCDMS